MKKFIAATLLGMLAITSGCATYSVPQATSTIQLNLTSAEVTFNQDVKGTGSSFTIFPFYLWLGPASVRAEDKALANAMEQAFDTAQADFIFEPRKKTSYTNLLLFDFASSEVVGKGVKLNK